MICLILHDWCVPCLNNDAESSLGTIMFHVLVLCILNISRFHINRSPTTTNMSAACRETLKNTAVQHATTCMLDGFLREDERKVFINEQWGGFNENANRLVVNCKSNLCVSAVSKLIQCVYRIVAVLLTF
jgi:hypothetical protein